MNISKLVFEEHQASDDGDVLYAATVPLGRITVLDRMTGWGNGVRDTESGYRDPGNNFWLASGMFDIREFGDLSIEEGIAKIKEFANTCVGDDNDARIQ